MRIDWRIRSLLYSAPSFPGTNASKWICFHPTSLLLSSTIFKLAWPLPRSYHGPECPRSWPLLFYYHWEKSVSGASPLPILFPTSPFLHPEYHSPLHGYFVWEALLPLTNDAEPLLGPSDPHIDLMWVTDKAQVFLQPAFGGPPINFTKRTGANCT